MVLGRRGSGGERRLDTLWMCQLQSTVHLVSRDVVEPLALVLLGQRLPVELGSLQQRQCSHDIGAGEGEGIFDGAVDMALGSKVDDAVYMLVLHQLVESLEVADVHLHELVVRTVLNILQVCQVAGVGQLVEIDDVILRVLVHEQAHHMAPYEAGATSNNYCLRHTYLRFTYCAIYDLSDSLFFLLLKMPSMNITTKAIKKVCEASVHVVSNPSIYDNNVATAATIVQSTSSTVHFFSSLISSWVREGYHFQVFER